MPPASDDDEGSPARRLLSLAGPAPWASFPWLRLIDADECRDLADVAATPTEAGPHVVRGERSRSSAANLAEWGRALDFPSYYGRNYPALTDCLREVVGLGPSDGRRRSPVVVLVTQAAELLIDAPPAELRALLASVDRAARGPRAADSPPPASLVVLLSVAAADRAALVARLDVASTLD